MKREKPIVAIDGPVGAGKSTTARKVAESLGYIYIDTGAMYRAVTVDVLDHGIDPENEERVAEIVGETRVELSIADNGQRTVLNSVDVTERIRDRDVTAAVSAVSAMKAVREKMTEFQRDLGCSGGVVMEGRDIGTVVFPDAEFKIYLDADVEVRALRRHTELQAKGVDMPLKKLIEEIRERDRANTNRAIAPLRKADDAITIDTTDMTFDEQVDAIVSLVSGGGGEKQKKRQTSGVPRRGMYKATQAFFHMLFRILFRIKYVGMENIPMEGGVIIASNHASLIDPTSVGTHLNREACYMAKKELFPVPGVSWLLKLSNSIPVDRGGFTRSSIQNVVNRLREGYAVVMFPEGTRTKDGNFLKPKTGVGMVASTADVPIVPCWVEGSFKAKPFRSQVTVHYLPPFHPSEIGGETKKEHYLLVSERIMYDIKNLASSHNGRA